MDQKERNARKAKLLRDNDKAGLADQIIDFEARIEKLHEQMTADRYREKQKVQDAESQRDALASELEGANRRVESVKRAMHKLQMREAVKHGQLIEARANQTVRRGDFDASLDRAAMSIIEDHYGEPQERFRGLR